jgi:uncharacterized protein YdhG (YjbR/CyaY superfamily)
MVIGTAQFVMPKQPDTVEDYLQSLPADRRAAMQKVREVVLANLPEGYEECVSYGMIGYVVPHKLYPAGYHCNPELPLPFVNLGSQKNHMALYLMHVYGDPKTEEWFRKAYAATGKKLDMGKSCVRFRKAEDLPLDVIGQVIARMPVKDYIARFEALLASRPSRTKPKKAPAKKKAAA